MQTNANNKANPILQHPDLDTKAADKECYELDSTATCMENQSTARDRTRYSQAVLEASKVDERNLDTAERGASIQELPSQEDSISTPRSDHSDLLNPVALNEEQPEPSCENYSAEAPEEHHEKQVENATQPCPEQPKTPSDLNPDTGSVGHSDEPFDDASQEQLKRQSSDSHIPAASQGNGLQNLSNESRDAEIWKLRQALESLSSERDTVRSNLEITESRANVAEHERDDLRQTHASLSDNLVTANEALLQAADQLEILIGDKTALQEELDSAKDQMFAYKTDMEEAERSFQHAVDHGREEAEHIGEMARQLEKIKDEKIQKSQKAYELQLDLQARNKILRQKNKDLKRENSRLREEYDKLYYIILKEQNLDNVVKGVAQQALTASAVNKELVKAKFFLEKKYDAALEMVEQKQRVYNGNMWKSDLKIDALNEQVSRSESKLLEEEMESACRGKALEELHDDYDKLDQALGKQTSTTASLQTRLDECLGQVTFLTHNVLTQSEIGVAEDWIVARMKERLADKNRLINDLYEECSSQSEENSRVAYIADMHVDLARDAFYSIIDKLHSDLDFTEAALHARDDSLARLTAMEERFADALKDEPLIYSPPLPFDSYKYALPAGMQERRKAYYRFCNPQDKDMLLPSRKEWIEYTPKELFKYRAIHGLPIRKDPEFEEAERAYDLRKMDPSAGKDFLGISLDGHEEELEAVDKDESSFDEINGNDSSDTDSDTPRTPLERAPPTIVATIPPGCKLYSAVPDRFEAPSPSDNLDVHINEEDADHDTTYFDSFVTDPWSSSEPELPDDGSLIFPAEGTISDTLPSSPYLLPASPAAPIIQNSGLSPLPPQHAGALSTDMTQDDIFSDNDATISTDTEPLLPHQLPFFAGPEVLSHPNTDADQDTEVRPASSPGSLHDNMQTFNAGPVTPSPNLPEQPSLQSTSTTSTADTTIHHLSRVDPAWQEPYALPSPITTPCPIRGTHTPSRPFLFSSPASSPASFLPTFRPLAPIPRGLAEDNLHVRRFRPHCKCHLGGGEDEVD
ncbi:MAG: hypothetical protein Q9227_002926 [Pyrenula ochraceoflavens]